MCGIVGFIGKTNSTDFLIKGLKKLEYRGYDSAGITVLGDGFTTIKTVNRIEGLKSKASLIDGKIGIGHTRWATHGRVNTENAHPHLSNKKEFACVHNGIIENYTELKEELLADNFTFLSDTDTEVIPNLLEKNYRCDLKSAVFNTLSRLTGAYALGIICSHFPDILIAAKNSSPLIIGLGKNENYIASDISALKSKTDKVIYLKDGQVAFITNESVTLYNSDKTEATPEITTIKSDYTDTEKGDFPHFMLKEIYEQPNVLKRLFAHYIKDGEIYIDSLSADIKKFDKIDIVACGSAYHAGLAAKYFFEAFLKKQINVDYASEYRYKESLADSRTLTIAISQSGETADTIKAAEKARKNGSYTLSIVNTEQSTLSRISDCVLYTLAGEEISVATTKGYLSQVALLYILGLFFAKRLCNVSHSKISLIKSELLNTPQKIEAILQNTEIIKQTAQKIKDSDSVFFIGRGIDYAVSLEAALKLKEISYIHAESYPAGELKHGSIALLEEGTKVIALLGNKRLCSKTISNIKEAAARGGYIIAVNNDANIKAPQNLTIPFPECEDITVPLTEIIPLQLLAYYTALYKGCDIDKPRNLAKSVTVE